MLQFSYDGDGDSLQSSDLIGMTRAPPDVRMTVVALWKVQVIQSLQSLVVITVVLMLCIPGY